MGSQYIQWRHGTSPLLITLIMSEVYEFEYAGLISLGEDDDYDSAAGRFMVHMIDTFIDAAAQHDHGIRRMPIAILLARIHRTLDSE